MPTPPIRVAPSGPVSSDNQKFNVVLATFYTDVGTPNPGQFLEWSRYSDSFPSNDDWEIISDGGSGQNQSALLVPESALGNLVQVSGTINTTNSESSPTVPAEVAMQLLSYNEDTNVSTQVVFATNNKFGESTQAMYIPISFSSIIDLRGITERRNAQILWQCLTDNTVIHLPVLGGYLTFEVKFIS